MARTIVRHRLWWMVALPAAVLLMFLVTPHVGEAQAEDDADVETGTAGAVEIRVETSGSVTTDSLLAQHEPFLLDFQDDLRTIVGTTPESPILIRFAGALPSADEEGWISVSPTVVVNEDATEAVVMLDQFLSLSETDARNVFRNLLSRRSLVDASDGAMPAPLVDGFAIYLESPVLARQARQASLAQQAYLDGDLPPWDELIASPEATADLEPDAARSSRTALAAFLVERYGANIIADLAIELAVEGGDDPAGAVVTVTGQPQERLTEAWDDFLATWFAGGWRNNAFSALDLQPAQDLFDRGAYEAAVNRANETLRVTSALDDTVASAEAEMLVAQGSVGMQAEALMTDAEAALAEHDYSRALTLIDRAVDQYALLPEHHRPDSLIETWRGIATEGLAAVDRLNAASESFDDWFSMRSSRQDAVAAGTVFAELGDTERLAIAEQMVDDLDQRFLKLVFALGGAITILTGWLLVWSWHRAPGRIHWPGLTDLARREGAL